MQAVVREAPQKPSYQGVIAADEEAVLRPIAAITAGVTGIVDKVQTLLVYWEKKYKSIWDQDKDAYMRCDSAKNSTGVSLNCTAPNLHATGSQEI